ncbi:MAG: inositol monophosphatase [Gemmatimonadota bacterium]|nr:MAG: inositol monophosphatase [Gemmatimonadota bacterium]
MRGFKVPQQKDLLQVAKAAAEKAAQHIRSVSQPPDPASWDLKGVSDFVTQVDRDSEQIIQDILLREFPDSIVVGEELSPGSSGSGDDLVWIVDPLDGTTNFLHGYPAYAVSIAAQRDGVLKAGVVVNVHRGQVYTASVGCGAWCGDVRLRVSHTKEPTSALIGTGFPFKTLDLMPEYLQQFSTILNSTSGVRRAGSAALDLVDVALGRFDGFWELSLAPWDIAAGTLLVREAGGVVTDIVGQPTVVRQGSIVAGNPVIHAWLLGLLSAQQPSTPSVAS